MPQSQDCRRAATAALLFTICTAVVLTAFPLSADAQIFVYPQRPTQSNVQYFDFEWFHKDIEIGPEANTGGADALESGASLDRLAQWFPQLHQNPHQEFTDHHSGQLPRRHGIADYQSSSPSVAYDDFPDPAEDTGTEPPPPTFGEDPQDLDDQSDYEAPFEESDLDEKQGGVRLYFYDRERHIAERAAAFIRQSYRELVDIFGYVPSTTLPYVLYNSYQEFLQTNIFPVQEGVLGVTGRAELELVLPYFGDHRLFQHISTHEMVHQFQIQKAREVVESAGLAGDPLDQMPLWFIEGMAEYYALGGMDAEAEMLTRDLLLNPAPERGYMMLDFFEDRRRSQLWTYKIGQARVAFLEDVYGEGTIQEVFDRSYRLVGSRDERQRRTFRTLLASITGDTRRQISDKFEAWIKDRSYRNHLDSRQGPADVDFLDDTRGLMQTMTTSPDGHLLMYRSIQRGTGQVRLHVTDTRDDARHRRLARDGKPGVESLHPVGPRTFDIHQEQAVFFARSEGKDILYLQEIRHRAEQDDNNEWDIRLRTGSRSAYDLGEHNLLAAESPAYSPDGRRIAFIGLDEDGEKNLYVFEALEGDDFIITQLTDDEFAPRGVSWGSEGIVYTSDATSHGKYNLFRVDIDTGPGDATRLTFEDRDHFEPRVLPDGRIFFSAYGGSRAHLYEWSDEGIRQRTEFVTGLFDAAPGPDGSIWANFHHRGQRTPVNIASDTLLDDRVEENASTDDNDNLDPFPTYSLDGADRYRPSDISNWQISNLFGVLGASGAGVFGQLMLMTNDRLRNHAFFVNILAFGDLNNTVADFLYLNQSSRLIWGTGLFQDVRYRIDRSLPAEAPRFLSGERFYGARGTLRYPLNRFMFIQGGLAVGGVTFFVGDRTRNRLADADFLQQWEDEHDEHRFQTSPSLSLGHNTIRMHPGTGPIDGTSALLSSTLDVQPFDSETHGQVRLDAERYFPIYDRINISLRGGTGSTFGGDLARQFFLSSYDTLRGVEFGDEDYLLGNQFFFSKLELRFPLNFLVRVPLIDIEGVVGSDFGGAGQDLADVWRWRSLSPVLGLNFGLGPLVFRLHFAKPIDIGAPRLPRDGAWIPNFSLGWRYW